MNRLDYRSEAALSSSESNNLSGCYTCLKSLTTNSNMTAPAVAVMIEPISPPAEMPSKPNTKPPTTAPIMPITILPSRPKPPPFIKVPANQPATAPIAKKITNPVTSIVSPLYLLRTCSDYLQPLVSWAISRCHCISSSIHLWMRPHPGRNPTNLIRTHHTRHVVAAVDQRRGGAVEAGG